MSDAGIPFGDVAKFAFPTTPLWTMRSATFIYELHKVGKKADTQPDLFLSKYRELVSTLNGYTRLFTDGSKDGAAVAAAAVAGAQSRSCRLPDNSSIFSAEAHAILLATDLIKSNNSNTKFVIFSDSLSCLQAIQNRRWDNPIVLNILGSLHFLATHGKSVVFVWLPSHIGIAGNSKADAEAKAALAQPVSRREVPHTDFKPLIASYLSNRWQQSWDLEIHNKLHALKPRIESRACHKFLNRREERVWHRLRIGHTHLTHSYLLRDENRPECIPCQCPLTIEHILISCVDFDLIRPHYFTASTMFDLFNTASPRNILDFVKEIGLYNKF
jgi:ribonuclease HI